MIFILCALGAFIAGFLAGLLGIGGGVILVPMLLFLLPIMGADNLVMHSAVATSLMCIVVSGTVAAYGHHRKLAVDKSIAMRWMWLSITGAVFGGFWASYAPGKVLRVIYVIVLISLCAHRLLFPVTALFKRENAARSGLVFPFVTGWLSAVLGVGGGSNVPLLSLYGVTIRKSIGTSAILGVGTAIIGVLVYGFTGMRFRDVLPAYSLGFINMPAVLIIAPTMVIATPLGVAVAHKLTARVLNVVFCFVFIVMGLYVLWGILS